MRMRPLAERFWEKVRIVPDGEACEACWEWMGSRDRRGLGRIVRGSSLLSTARAAWTLTYGEVPRGAVIGHRCHNPSCVRPTHLFIGTRLEVSQHMGRSGRGSATTHQVERVGGRTRLEEIKAAVRKEYEGRNSTPAKDGRTAPGGVTVRALAAKYGVGKSWIAEMVNGR